MKYVPKRAVRVRTPDGRETTLFTRGPLTPGDVLATSGIGAGYYVAHQGRRLSPDVSVWDQGVHHDGLLEIVGG